ncbi:MAG: hypothetical protein U5K54_10495 [Cytophagales bacterium]|nr:hypothetical protein [Cytophagales bacterium]
MATIHDTLFVIASFAIARALGISFEIDQVFVAALLTIIGYSINDTVIIFDRIQRVSWLWCYPRSCAKCLMMPSTAR